LATRDGEAARALEAPNNPRTDPDASAAEPRAQERIKSRREKSLERFEAGFMFCLFNQLAAAKEEKYGPAMWATR